MFYFAVVVFFQSYKAAVRNAKDDTAATILLQTIAGVGVLALTPFFALKISHDLRPHLLLAAACMFYAVNDRADQLIISCGVNYKNHGLGSLLKLRVRNQPLAQEH